MEQIISISVEAAGCLCWSRSSSAAHHSKHWSI